MEMVPLALVIAIIFPTLFLFLTKNRDSNNKLPRNWPILGMIPTLIFHLNPYFLDWIAGILGQSERCTFLLKGLWFENTTDLLLTADPSNIRYITSSHYENFLKGPDFHDIFEVLGDGIFAAEEDSWKIQRKITHALINQKPFYTFVAETSKSKIQKGLLPVLDHVSEQGTVIDLQDLFQRLTYDSITTLVFGLDPNTLSIEFPHLAITNAIGDMEEVVFLRHLIPKFSWELQKLLGFGLAKKMSRARETIEEFVEEFLCMKKTQLLHQGDECNFDLLSSYMNEDLMASMGMLKCDHKFLRDTIVNIMVAGRDTTSAALSWFFWLVSKNSSVQIKIREELRREILIPADEAVDKKKTRIFGIEEVNNLVYLHGALCESLRLYPSVPFNHKVASKPDILPSGHHVNTKMKVILSFYAMGRMRSVWGEDCQEFKPERWISDEGRIKHEPSYKFSAFNAGPRSCLGKEVTFIQLKMVASSILHSYNVEVVEGHAVVPSSSVILHMKHGLKVKIAKRSD